MLPGSVRSTSRSARQIAKELGYPLAGESGPAIGEGRGDKYSWAM